VDPDAPLLVAALAAAVVATACTPLARRIATSISLVDHPGGHRVHETPTPVFGGFAVAAGTVVAALVVAGVPVEVTATLGVALALAVDGFADDRRPLPPTVRLACEAAGGLALVAAGARAQVGPDVLDPVFVVMWFVAVVNAFNMIDNHDGICSSLGVIAAAGAGTIAWRGGELDVAVLAGSLAGAAAGFLRSNLPKASIFLGDTGSMFIGATVAALVLWLPTPTGSSLQRLTVAALLLLVPFLDEGTAIITRLRERRGPMMAATDHLSHRLRLRGAAPRGVVARLAGLQVVAAIAAVVVWDIRGQAAIAVTAAVCLAIGIALLLACLRMPHPGAETGT
jgi:UDP-GlcNAc:undecaprenyl-phosphate GlcNAc-1-phosphate transferase